MRQDFCVILWVFLSMWLWGLRVPGHTQSDTPFMCMCTSVSASHSLRGFPALCVVLLFSCSGLYLTQVIIFGGLEACCFTKKGIWIFSVPENSKGSGKRVRRLPQICLTHRGHVDSISGWLRHWAGSLKECCRKLKRCPWVMSAGGWCL